MLSALKQWVTGKKEPDSKPIQIMTMHTDQIGVPPFDPREHKLPDMKIENYRFEPYEKWEKLSEDVIGCRIHAKNEKPEGRILIYCFDVVTQKTGCFLLPAPGRLGVTKDDLDGFFGHCYFVPLSGNRFAVTYFKHLYHFDAKKLGSASFKDVDLPYCVGEQDQISPFYAVDENFLAINYVNKVNSIDSNRKSRDEEMPVVDQLWMRNFKKPRYVDNEFWGELLIDLEPCTVFHFMSKDRIRKTWINTAGEMTAIEYQLRFDQVNWYRHILQCDHMELTAAGTPIKALKKEQVNCVINKVSLNAQYAITRDEELVYFLELKTNQSRPLVRRQNVWLDPSKEGPCRLLSDGTTFFGRRHQDQTEMCVFLPQLPEPRGLGLVMPSHLFCLKPTVFAEMKKECCHSHQIYLNLYRFMLEPESDELRQHLGEIAKFPRVIINLVLMYLLFGEQKPEDPLLEFSLNQRVFGL